MNNRVPSDYWKCRPKAERPAIKHKPREQPRLRRKPEPLDNIHDVHTVSEEQMDRTKNEDLLRTTASTRNQLWTDHHLEENSSPPIGQLSSNRGG